MPSNHVTRIHAQHAYITHIIIISWSLAWHNHNQSISSTSTHSLNGPKAGGGDGEDHDDFLLMLNNYNMYGLPYTPSLAQLSLWLPCCCCCCCCGLPSIDECWLKAGLYTMIYYLDICECGTQQNIQFEIALALHRSVGIAYAYTKFTHREKLIS